MDTPSIADYPDEMMRLREWRRRREVDAVVGALAKEPDERTEAEWTVLAYSPMGHAAGCRCR